MQFPLFTPWRTLDLLQLDVVNLIYNIIKHWCKKDRMFLFWFNQCLSLAISDKLHTVFAIAVWLFEFIANVLSLSGSIKIHAKQVEIYSQFMVHYIYNVLKETFHVEAATKNKLKTWTSWNLHEWTDDCNRIAYSHCTTLMNFNPFYIFFFAQATLYCCILNLDYRTSSKRVNLIK